MATHPAELVIASCRFEAARKIAGLPIADRRSALHGHGFIASVQAKVPRGWAAFQGSECVELQGRLERCVGPLDYSLLNTQLAIPTDENIAAWIVERVDVPGIARLAVQSTPNQGAHIAPGEQMAHIWRRYSFQAAHRLPHVSAGHKCGRLHGHGFALVIHAMQDHAHFGYDELDALWAPLHAALNYRCLNDICGLENPTSEMVSSWVWERLKPLLPSLSAITVFETGSCGATYDGARYRIWKDFTFDSAVRLGKAPARDPRYGVHGHTYLLRLKLTAPLDAVMGWTVDFGDVKEIFEPVRKSLDHHPLHEQAEIDDGDAATIAKWIYRRVLPDLPQLSSVELYETEGCGVAVGLGVSDPGLPV